MSAPGFGLTNQIPPRRGIGFGAAVGLTFGLWRSSRRLLAAAAIPTAVWIIVSTAFIAMALPVVIARASSLDFSTLFVVVPAFLVGGGVLTGLISTQLSAVVVLRASAENRQLTFGEALRRTRGVSIRALSGWLLLGAIQWSGIAGLGWWLQDLRRTLVHDPDAVAAVLIQLGLIAAGMLVLAILIPLLWAKFFLFMPVLAHESVDGLVALRRSWQLTKGAFGSILFALMLVSLVWVIAGAITAQALSIVLPGGAIQPGEPGNYLIIALAWVILQSTSLVITPFLWLFSAVLYRQQAGLDSPSSNSAPPQRYPDPTLHPWVGTSSMATSAGGPPPPGHWDASRPTPGAGPPPVARG